MIRYHGGPIWPEKAAIKLWKGRHGFVSFYRPDQIEIAAEQCDTFAIDNGAYSFWRLNAGQRVDVPAYADFVQRWSKSPSFDWCLIPDIIDGTEDENDDLVESWDAMVDMNHLLCVPVWHLHESLARLDRLMQRYPRVALGSSGQYEKLRTSQWVTRMNTVMERVCDPEGFPRTKLHGLRMLSGEILRDYPLASADSTNIARNIVFDQAWRGPYAPKSKVTRAIIIAENMDHDRVCKRWAPGSVQRDFELMAT